MLKVIKPFIQLIDLVMDLEKDKILMRSLHNSEKMHVNLCLLM